MVPSFMFQTPSHKCEVKKCHSTNRKTKRCQTPLSLPSLCEQVFGIAKGHHKAREKVEETLQCVKKTRKARHVKLGLFQLELKYWDIVLYKLRLTTRMKTVGFWTDWTPNSKNIIKYLDSSISTSRQIINSRFLISQNPTVAGHTQRKSAGIFLGELKYGLF